MKTMYIAFIAHFIAVLAVVHSKTNEQRTLVDAVRNEDENMVRSLIQNGTDIRTRGTFGKPILIEAILKGQENIAKLLIELGADLNEQWSLITPFRAAIFRGSTSIVNLLIQKKVDVNQQISYASGGKLHFLESPLVYAAKKNRGEIFEILLKNGANVNATNLEWAIKGHADIEAILNKYAPQPLGNNKHGYELGFRITMNITDNFRALRNKVQKSYPLTDLSNYELWLENYQVEKLNELLTLEDLFLDFDSFSITMEVRIRYGNNRIEFFDLKSI